MQLNDFQAQFKELMLDEPEALENPPEELAANMSTGDIPLTARLNVYRTNIVGGLTDVVMESFPLIKALVGEEFLQVMARSFVMEHPPSAGYLHYYGEGFAEFIEGYEMAKAVPYLPDMARLELALNRSYYAEEDAALSAADLSATPPEKLGALQLPLRENVQLLNSPHPLHDIRKFIQDGGEADAPDIQSGGVKLMITRPKETVDLVVLEDGEYEVLEYLLEGKPLGEAVEAVLSTHGTFNFQEFLQKHLTLETFLTLNTNR